MDEATLGRWDWLLASVMISTLASLIHWFVGYLAGAHSRRRPGTEPWTVVLRGLSSPWLRYPVRLLYGLGLPAAALLWQGALTTRSLGLRPLRPSIPVQPAIGGWGPATWGKDIVAATTVGGVTAIVVLMGLAYARSGSHGVTAGRRNLGRALLEALYYQTHWAFYRAPFVMVWGIGLGSWAGALLALLETGISLMFWERLQTAGTRLRQRLVVRLALLVAGTQLYLLSQNLWFALALDGTIGWLALRWEDDAEASQPQSVASEAMTTIR